MPSETEPKAPRQASARRRWIRRARRSNYRGEPVAPKPNGQSAALDRARELERERDRLKEGMARSQAEFDNFRKRMRREREEANRRAGEEVIASLLPVLDNLQRALSAAQSAPDAQSISKGVEMIHEQFRNALLGRGLTPVEALGKAFDPMTHEAVGVESRDDTPENQVIQVLQEGFLLGGKLLRPAMVKVAKKKA